MEIERIEAIGLRRELSEPFANAQKWITSREYCLVRVESAGHVGWGECWGPIAGNREIIEGVIAPWLRGRDPSYPEAVHDDLEPDDIDAAKDKIGAPAPSKQSHR
ncbi:hypothetical protein BRC68_13490 [Halobacteriales archaeon QH_6_64_20]|nr:MAG: hypothetical protein BRC68_13490 [Halobacteriales archaeon QH_6_64_20]